MALAERGEGGKRGTGEEGGKEGAGSPLSGSEARLCVKGVQQLSAFLVSKCLLSLEKAFLSLHLSQQPQPLTALESVSVPAAAAVLSVGKSPSGCHLFTKAERPPADPIPEDGGPLPWLALWAWNTGLS